jgi:hypothetical protein
LLLPVVTEVVMGSMAHRLGGVVVAVLLGLGATACAPADGGDQEIVLENGKGKADGDKIRKVTLRRGETYHLFIPCAETFSCQAKVDIKVVNIADFIPPRDADEYPFQALLGSVATWTYDDGDQDWDVASIFAKVDGNSVVQCMQSGGPGCYSGVTLAHELDSDDPDEQFEIKISGDWFGPGPTDIPIQLEISAEWE